MRIESVWNLHEIIYETVFESISDSKNQLIEKITGWMVGWIWHGKNDRMNSIEMDHDVGP